jgi:hypothetical protein
MSSLPKEISEFMDRYKVNSDEVWPVPGGRAFAIKHKALERIAVERGIKFERPSVIACDLERRSMVVCTFATMGERTEWSFGEAAPENCKNQYMAAMAEKRSRDRVILKLLVANGDLYSEDESDDFKRAPAAEEEGIERVPGVQVLTVDAQRPIFSELKASLDKCFTVEECKQWKMMARAKASRLSDHWKKVLEEHFKDRKRECEKLEADEYIERMTG